MENQKSYALRNKAKFLKKIVVSPKVQYNKTQSAAYDRKSAIARNTRVYLCDFIISQKKGRKRFMQYREQIEAYLDAHKEEMLADICRLIRINSTKGEAAIDCPFGEGPAKALAEALEMAEGYGFTVKNYENYVGTADLNDMEKQLDILAHLDVVPAGDGWSVTEPYMPVIKDGRVYGRGSADDKGPAIAAMYAMRAVKELGIPLNKNVRLILGTDEECGSSDIAHYYAVEKEAPMTFSPDAVSSALGALTDRGNTVIVTDTNMTRSGIHKASLEKLGIEAVCYMADPDVAEEAKREGTTRAAASMKKAADMAQKTGKQIIFSVGNAPTALIAIEELIREGCVHPALVIGVPVGFVNVVQAKERIMTVDVPYIVAKGRKGGSTVAVAILNALLYKIDKER